MHKYIGTYMVFYEHPIDSKPVKVTVNEEQNENGLYIPELEKGNSYIQGKAGIQIYRYFEDKLAIVFLTTNSSNTIVPKLNNLGITLTPFAIGDQESVYLFDEKFLEQVDSLVKFQIKGKLNQLKEYKRQLKLQKKLEKENKKSKNKKS